MLAFLLLTLAVTLAGLGVVVIVIYLAK